MNADAAGLFLYMNVKKPIITFVLMIAIGAGVFFVYDSKNNTAQDPYFSFEALLSKLELTEPEVEAETLVEINDSVTASGDKELPLTYINKQFGFQFNLPEGYSGSSFTEGNGVTVLLQNQTLGQTFQIYIQNFDETEAVTIDRIQQDVPDLTINNPLNAIIARGDIEALVFEGVSDDFGKTREVWFVKGGNLYQVIAPFEMEHTIGPIVESLSFSEI